MKRGVIVDAVLFMLSICDGNGKDDDGSRTIAIVPPALASAIIVHFRFWLLFGAAGETVRQETARPLSRVLLFLILFYIWSPSWNIRR